MEENVKDYSKMSHEELLAEIEQLLKRLDAKKDEKVFWYNKTKEEWQKLEAIRHIIQGVSTLL